MSPPGCHSWTLNTVCPNLNLSFFSLKHVCPFIQANITTQLSKSDPGRYPYYFPAPAPRAPNSAHFTSHIFSLPLPIPNTVYNLVPLPPSGFFSCNSIIHHCWSNDICSAWLCFKGLDGFLGLPVFSSFIYLASMEFPLCGSPAMGTRGTEVNEMGLCHQGAHHLMVAGWAA